MRFINEYAFLSNMQEFAPVEVDGISYKSAENYYQAHKSLNESVRATISRLAPKASKAYSRKVKLREDWDKVKDEVMWDALNLKFSNNPELIQLLINVKEDIVEDNYWKDTYWGVCDGVGENVLGKMLMSLRDFYMKQQVVIPAPENMFYTGIGSRETPKEVQELMTKIARKLDSMGYTLRSGGANGADKAFEDGVSDWRHKDIFIPKAGFNGSNSTLCFQAKEAFDIAESWHPNWKALNIYVRKLMARNIYQVLGHSLDNPSKFLICWTKDGCESNKDRTHRTGGTGQAISVADGAGIEVINLSNQAQFDRMVKFLENN